MVNKDDTKSPASLRRTHRGMVLSLIQSSPGISRADLARSLGFSEMAATRIVRELVEARIVEEITGDVGAKAKGSRKRLGRPKIGLRILGGGLFAGGITVSAYHSEVSICDGDGLLIARKAIPYLVSDDIEATARSYGRELAQLIDDSGVDPTRFVGVGVALAARTSTADNRIVRSDYFGWGSDDGAFHRALAAELELPIQIDNISNALAIAEMRFGVARGTDDFALIHVATLIGAAVMTRGQLVHGKGGISGMIGHFRSEATGISCVCGREDCLNLTATGLGILNKLGRLSSPGFDRAHLEEYAASLLDVVEDTAQADVVSAAGEMLAPALDSVCKLLGPEMVVVSGYIGSNDAYLKGVMAAASRDFGQEWAGRLPIVAGEIAPTRAAALLALSTFCYSDRLDFDRFAETAETTRVSRSA